MAIKLIGTKKLPNPIGDDSCEVLTAKEFLCDTDVDFADLPECCPSSMAVSIASGSVRVVNTEGQWVPFAGSSSGDSGESGGGGPLAYRIGPDEELPDDAMEGSLAIVTSMTSGWVEKTWGGLVYFSGGQIWTDGTNIYYSSYGNHYVLNGDTWESKTFNGSVYMDNISGDYIWTDGSHIYYSNAWNNEQYVLNKETDTWETKEWTINSDNPYIIATDNIWTDGIDMYISNGSEHYVLNRYTDTWEQKVWSGITEGFFGNKVWTDGTNIYCTITDSVSGASAGSATGKTYMLENGDWIAKHIEGSKYITDPRCIWSDGVNVYYDSYGGAHYVLNETRDAWEENTWVTNIPTYGGDTWTDGTNIYYSTTGLFANWVFAENHYASSFLYSYENGEWVKKIYLPE